MQEDKIEILYDPNQLFPIPYTLISNLENSFTSVPLKQPFQYEVYCPLSCKKIKIGVLQNEKNKQTLEFNTTSSRFVSIFVNNDIKYLVNGHNPVKKDKKKASGDKCSIYVQVFDKGNIAIFNPYFFNPERPLNFYTFKPLLESIQPSNSFEFTENIQDKTLTILPLNNRQVFIQQSNKGTFISHNTHFSDIKLSLITISDPYNKKKTLQGEPVKIKKQIDEHLNFWLNELENYINLQKLGKSINPVKYNLDQIYQRLNYFLNIDEQLRMKLLTNVNKNNVSQLYGYHPRIYNAINRLISFLNYGNTRFNVFKLAELGFVNKTDMLQNLSFMQNLSIPIPTAQQFVNQTQEPFRQRIIPFSRLARGLPYPNVSLQTCINSISPQTISKNKIIYTSTSDPYVIFMDEQLKFSAWSGIFTLTKLFDLDILKQNSSKSQQQIIIKCLQKKSADKNPVSKQKQNKANQSNQSQQSLGNLFTEQQQKPVIIKPDVTMVQQLLTMGYKLTLINQALINVKNQSIPVAIDQIDKLIQQELNNKSNKTKKQMKKQWSCPMCTLVNPPTAEKCQVCQSLPDFSELQAIQQAEKAEKQRLQLMKRLEEKKIQDEKIQKQKQLKEKQQIQKKMKQQLIKQQRINLYKSSKIVYAKLFKSTKSFINPFIFVVIFVDQKTKKSILKISRIGYNRELLTKFYRYEDGNFVSNLNCNLFQGKGDQVNGINSLLQQSWIRIQVISRIAQGYQPNQYFIIQEQQIIYDFIINSANSDGQLISFNKQNGQKSFKIEINDTIMKSEFKLLQVQQILKIQEKQDINKEIISYEIKLPSIVQAQGQKSISLNISSNTSSCFIQVIQHLPSGKFKPLASHSNNFIAESKIQGQIVMSEFIPLMIQDYEGSIFSSKYHSTSLFDRHQPYISNYPDTSFTFKNIQGKNMLIQTVTIISQNKRLQKIFPIQTGLIFTANQLSWFYVAKNIFGKFKRKQYQNWINTKKSKNQYRQFWQPVGFFQLDGEIQIQIDYKRSAKYVFFLPTSVKTFSEKIQIAAVKIDFFGVKGRVQENNQQYLQFYNYKNDCQTNNKLTVKTQNKQQHYTIQKRSSVNTFNYLPICIKSFSQIPLTVSTIYEIKFRNLFSKKNILIESQFLHQVRLTQQSTTSKTQSNKNYQIQSYKQLIDNFVLLNQSQVISLIQKFDIKQFLLLLLNNNKSFTIYDKILKLIFQIQTQKQKMYEVMVTILPKLCEDQYEINQYGLKTFLRIYEKVFSINNKSTLKSAQQSWNNVTVYIKKIRNKNYNVIRNKYGIQQLILQPTLFSKDYYRLIHPNFIEDQLSSSIVQTPKTNINNLMYLQRQNSWLFKNIIDLGCVKNVQKIDIYFPKITNINNRFKLAIKVYKISDQNQQLVYYRTFNEEFLVQFSTIAYKQKQIYHNQQNKINYFTINVDKVGRFFRFQYSYLILTTLNNIKYKQPTESLTLYPIITSDNINQSQSTHNTQKYQKLVQYLYNTFPKQAKHNSLLQNLPPFKYSVDRSFSFYQIYDFPIFNQSSVQKQYSSIIDVILTNITDKQIVQTNMKKMKITQYQYNKKGLDFAYNYLIHLLKMFKKMPSDYKASIQLLLEMFDIFVVYQIGPIMKKVQAFISEVYKRYDCNQKALFIQRIINTYLSNYSRYKQLKENQKYSILKVIQKIQQYQLPIGLLINKLSQSYEQNNLFLVTMLLKIIKPNIDRFGLNQSLLNVQLNKTNKIQYKLKHLISISFKFNLWVLDNVDNIKIQLLNQGIDLLLTFMNGKYDYVEKNKSENIQSFINSIEEKNIWKIVFLILKIKNQQLNLKIHKVFQILMQNTTQKFKKNINTMLLQIIKKKPNSIYTQINGQVNDDLWMNHLQTILQYLDIQKQDINLFDNNNKDKNKGFTLDIDTSIQLLNLPLTPVLWSHVLLIIPKQDRVLNNIIKNFKQQYYPSLGKQITKFCQPLAGIRSIQSIHINWLDLVKKIRLQNKSIFSLFIEQLRKSNYGGKQGVAMSTSEEVKQLQITSEFLKLALQKELPQKQLTKNIIDQIFVWYFLNLTQAKGQSPASQLLKLLSENVYKLIKKFTQIQSLVPLCIKSLLQIKKDSQKMQGMFQQKRIPAHSALSLTSRFCKCFENLMNIFMINDKISQYFTFQINGLQYILEKLNLFKKKEIKISEKVINVSRFLHEQQFLLDQKILSKKVSNINNNPLPIDLKSFEDLKQQQFATNVKLVANMNQTATTTSLDWTIYKKGNKSKIIFLPMTDPSTYFQYPLYIQLSKSVQVRSIKIGFPSASFQHTDKIVVSPSSVLIQGSMDMKYFQPLGQMTYIDDDGYICNGVKVFVLNLQKISTNFNHYNKIDHSLKSIEAHRVKYLKIVVKRPLVTFIQGQYSPLNGKYSNNMGCNISFLSVIGDDVAKLPNQLVDSCKQISKKTALNILSILLTQKNSSTMKKISNHEIFSSKLKQNFNLVKQLMEKNKQIVSQIIYKVGAHNIQLGDWLIQQFIRSGRSQIQAKIINQIIVSTPSKVYQRINFFQKQLFNQLSIIRSQSQVQSTLLYNKYVPFMQIFCKTLQQCYEIDFHNIQSGQQLVLECDQEKINSIIDIYDKKHSSPEIKSLLKLLISLIWIRKPLKLSQYVISTTLDLIWNNCSQDKPYFYNIMSVLLVSKISTSWVSLNDHAKIKSLIKQTQISLKKQNIRSLKSQMFLLSIFSYHQYEYLRSINYHLEIYNLLKVKIFTDSQIFDYLMKIQQNVVLGNKQNQKELAELLVKDVSLLVKRKDPILQKLFVGILAVEKQVMIHLKSVQLLSLQAKKNKKEYVPSKLLLKQQQKSLSEKINKKYKYHLRFQSQRGLSRQNFSQLLTSLYSGFSLLLMKIKIQNQTYILGAYLTTKPTLISQQQYQHHQIIKSDGHSFIFLYNQQTNNHSYVNITKLQSDIIDLYSSDQQQDYRFRFMSQGKCILNIHLPIKYSTQAQFLNKQTFKNQIIKQQKCKILNIQIYECKALNIISNQTKITQLLTKSNQAKVPFTWYRHNPIYIFPSQITIQKLQKLLSAKLILNKTQENPNIKQSKLLQIENDDFIIDLTIDNPDDYQGKQDFGYIPKMNIFQAFSQQGGINQVLRLGSDSIKDWKNVNRKKNFENYMEQLKSFIHLPNFFSLFIKNHKYVTFLFEVASGMPDDPNTSRNWEQQEVDSSRFIYKILSDIFKFDRSKQLRNMDKYEDFCQIILQKLSEISKEAARIFKEDQKKQQEQELQAPGKIEKKKTQDKKIRKKKGIGYGADNQNNSKWSPAQWLQIKKVRNQQIQKVVSIFVSFLDCQVSIQDQRITHIIKASCLLPLVQSALRSSSLLDISKEAQLFKSYLMIIKNLAKNPATINCLVEIQKTYKPAQTQSIHSLLSKLNKISDIFLQCLKSGKQNSDNSNQQTQSLALQIQQTYLFIDKAVRNLQKNKNSLTINQINDLSIQQAYRILLQNLRFGYIDLKKGNVFQHALHSSISSSSPSTQKILRLSQQLADLSSSLPCQHTNSIFVRCDKSRIDVVKILIMGSKDTPYSNGAFMFDLYCQDTYPNNPPKMVITTTGQGKIRFNPNLYSCGKVCLSLLGTWRGSASQNWDPKLSTLLQLFISTQGITMSQDVYFNEPGFDGQQGTQQGEKKNQAYSNIVRLGNVRYAMIQQIKNPPKGFQDVINRHFYIKRKQIIQQCQKWLQYAQKRQASYTGLVSDHNSSWCSQLKVTKTKYKQLLQKDFQTLKTLLNNLPEPNLKIKSQQQIFIQKSQKKKRKAKQQELSIDVGYQNNQKQQLKIQQNVMQDRWSRYIGAMGLQAVKKQSSSNVLLIGLKTLGLQIAKNLVLSGLQKLTIVQNNILDSGSEQHFYMSDLKGKKIQQCIFKIKQLNPYMIVEYKQSIPQSLKQYNLVVSTLSLTQSLKISQLCHKQSIKFVYTQTCGVSGNYFADFGQKFIINDPNGQQPFQGLIQKITSQKQGIVKLLDGIKHPYQDGDYVVFNKVQGMSIIKEQIQELSQPQKFYNQMISSEANQKVSKSINGRVFKIKVINWNSFSIGDTTNFTPYLRNGLVKNIKVPQTIKFQPFIKCVEQFDKYLDPNMGIYDFEKMSDNYNIFVCFKSMSLYQDKFKQRPQNWNEKYVQQFLEIVKQIMTNDKKSEEQIKSGIQFATKFSLVCQAELPSIGAYLGGLVSQQIIKGLTNKYTPINQFFVFHLNQLLQKIPQKQKWNQLSIKKQEPFRNIKIVVGQQNMKKIQQMKLFIVGAGAIGCQLLKNFAMVNMGAKGKITVTDPDHIQTSNLTRQFLFRQKHIKKPKSATAAAVLIQMNPNLKNHISARLDKVCQQTQDIYSDQFFKSQTLIANALDNVKARQYMDKRCVSNKLPLFESGTLGPKGHVQVIVPYKTQNYGSQADPNQQTQIPHCTLKMFPQDITHCIQWSRDIFGKVFTLNPKALKKVIQSKDTSSIQGKQKSTILKMIKYKPQKFQDCISQAVRIFFKYFRNDIRQLLYTYPVDMKTKQGKLFWSLPKRLPKQISQLDKNDQSHQTFISSYAVLFAKIFSIPYPKDFRKQQGKSKIMEYALNVKIQDFVPSKEKSKQLQELTEKQEKQKEKQMEIQQLQKQQSNQIQLKKEQQQQIDLTKNVLKMKIIPEQFQKDQDQNGHIDLIYSMSNLRARNYDLGECKWIDAKLKAGRIMAALSTTTSVVAALQTIEIIKLVSGSQIWRNAFVNLAVPLVQITQPGPATKQKIGNTQFSVWQDWQFKASSLQDLLNQIKNKFQVEGFNISTAEGTPIFWEAMYKDKKQAQQTLLNKKLQSIIGKQKVTLNILMRDLKKQNIYEKVPRIIVEATQ